MGRLQSLFMWSVISAAMFACSGQNAVCDQQETVFSGPQPGETLSPFLINGVYGDQADKQIDLVSQSKGGPLLLVFVHERTRPAFALTNSVLRFAATRKDRGLTAGMVFLSADPTETRNWLKIVRQHMPEDVTIGISPDGLEGPGSYGLNRNVAVTVLTGRDGKVTENFALIQPGVDVDGPGILKAIAAVTGGGDVPPISEFSGRAAMAERGPAKKARPVAEEQDPGLRPLLAPLIRKSATEEDVDKAAKAIIDYAAKNPVARRQIAEIANRIIAADKLSNYGTPKAQEYLQKWSEEFRAPQE